jgi:hypothetical protein
MAAPITPPITRFYRHVRREGACLLWSGHAAGRHPRPVFRLTTRQTDPKVYAHRWIYEQVVGPIPEGWEVDHLCQHGLCVDVAHLEAVPPKENQRRQRRAMCRAGLHDLSNPENCRWDTQGRRRGCRRCWLDAAQRRYSKGGQ